MSLTVLTAANSRRLCAVTDVLDELPEPVSMVERFVDQASAAIERYCGVIFAQQKYRELRTPEYGHILGLSRTPVVAVTALTENSTAITDYRLESIDAGLLYRANGWWLSGTLEWTIDYVAGYVLPEQTTPADATGPLLPGDVQRACVEAVKVWWTERELADRVQSKTLGLTGDRIAFSVSATKGSLPPLAKHLLMPWRRWVLA